MNPHCNQIQSWISCTYVLSISELEREMGMLTVM